MCVLAATETEILVNVRNLIDYLGALNDHARLNLDKRPWYCLNLNILRRKERK